MLYTTRRHDFAQDILWKKKNYLIDYPFFNISVENFMEKQYLFLDTSFVGNLLLFIIGFVCANIPGERETLRALKKSDSSLFSNTNVIKCVL